MSEHLPECQAAYKKHWRACICPWLRACEQRVRDEEITTTIAFGYGLERGLDKAREAVAGMPTYPATPYLRSSVAVHQEALAAIDALRHPA